MKVIQFLKCQQIYHAYQCSKQI
ncbi:unnamed protein product [Acanthoscelides obtectus]|uniref:Uncharacterized protein n=1 Tax=Acanthoscelides obtectus TaxID=200917 RepID=A0A9P0KUF1_ACAOB|nr:unnamed protein product [Acanthoscelides obtectus]CAK1628250.1 hypothetical protein AOBTE_LOCUS5094 [Acanthoscelides obtectus]